MTAREKRTVILPSLPPELWECIFDFATSVPGTLIPDIYEHSSLIGPPYNRRYHPALRAALITKRYLVRVCKQWWHLARRYLYQAIYIDKVGCLLSLSNTLKKYAVGDGTVPGVHSLGSWTQRLDVVIRDRSIDFDAECECLVVIIRSLPNLAIVSFAITSVSYKNTSMPFGIFDALRCNASSLRVLDWSTNGLFPDLALLEALLLREVPHLHILNCPALSWKNGFMPTHALSSVHTLIVYSLFATPNHSGPVDTGLTPTNLREVILDSEMLRCRSGREFMRRYGIHLTTVQIRQAYHNGRTLNTSLGVINRSCPNLRRITLSVIRFSLVSLEGFSLPPVEYFGVSAEAHQQPRSDYWQLFMILASIRDTVPTLRVVQLIDPRNVGALLTRHSKVAVRALDQQLAGSTFRVECHDGTLLIGWSNGTSLTPSDYVVADKLKAMGKM